METILKRAKVKMRKYFLLVGFVIATGLAIGLAGFLLRNSSEEERFIAEYGGYGIKGTWETLGKAKANIIFKHEKGRGEIILGENRYLVEVSKQSTIQKEGGQSTIYQGNLISREGDVKFVIYKDCIVGEISANRIQYSFGTCGSLESGIFLLDQYNEHLQEEGVKKGIIKPPEDVIF